MMDLTADIKVIEDFISIDDAETIINYIKQNKDDTKRFMSARHKIRSESVVPEMHKLRRHEEILPLYKKYSQKFIEETKLFRSDAEDMMMYAFWMTMLGPGTTLGPHVDNHKQAESIDFSGVIYLNDDYTGGEIHFTKLGIKHKPKARSLIVFKPELEHEIVSVIDGIRFAMPIWGTLNKEKEMVI